MKDIHPKYLPARSPFFLLGVFWLALDFYQAPGWLWGAYGALAIVLILRWFYYTVTVRWVHPSDCDRR